MSKYYKIRDLIFFTHPEPFHHKEGNGKRALLSERRMHGRNTKEMACPFPVFTIIDLNELTLGFLQLYSVSIPKNLIFQILTETSI